MATLCAVFTKDSVVSKSAGYYGIIDYFVCQQCILCFNLTVWISLTISGYYLICVGVDTIIVL